MAESRAAGNGTVGCVSSSLAAESVPQLCRRDGWCGPPFLCADSAQILKEFSPSLPPFLPLALSLVFSHTHTHTHTHTKHTRF